MICNCCSSAALAMAAMILGAVVPAIAQQAPAEVIVTARRMEERLQDVPISIAVYNEQQLEDRNVVSAKDLAIYTPSLSVNPRFGSEATSFSIRGFVQDQFTAPSVAIYFADVVAPRGASVLPAGDGAGPGSFFDLENTQVLKGPQGTLFGRNTTGGAILLVPHKPTGDLDGHVEVSAGNYDMERFQGVLNVPLGAKVRLRLGVDQMTRDGYLNNISGIGPSQMNNIDYIAGRASLVVNVTPNIENYSILSIAHSNTSGSIGRMSRCVPGLTSSGGPGVLVPLGAMTCAQIAREALTGDFFTVENSVQDPTSRMDQWQVINTTTWLATDDFTVKNIASYAQLQNDVRQDVYGTNWIIPPGANAGAGQAITLQVSGFPGLHLNHQSTAAEELQFQGHGLNKRLVWQAGAYFEFSDPLDPWAGTASPSALICGNVAAFQCSSPYAAFGSLATELRHTIYRDMGYYSQGSYNLTDAFRFTTGVRWTDDRSDGRDRSLTYHFNSAGARTTTGCTSSDAALPDCLSWEHQDSHAPTWLLGLDYKPAEDVLLYGKYARGYRQGLINPRGIAPYKAFGPEKVDSYEVGAKTSWQGPVPGMFDFAAFYNDFFDQQILVGYRHGTLSGNAITNTGTSRLWGVEAQLGLSPFEGFTLDASFTYLNTLLEKATLPTAPPPFTDADSLNRTLPGYPFPFAPPYKAAVTATYTLPVPEAVGKVSIGTTFSYTDAYAVIEGPGTRVGSYALLNLNMNWHDVGGRPIDLSLFATNVADKHYNIFLAETASLGILSTVAGEPRMVGVRLEYRVEGRER